MTDRGPTRAPATSRSGTDTSVAAAEPVTPLMRIGVPPSGLTPARARATSAARITPRSGHDLARAKVRDLRAVVATLRQDLVGLLAAHRRVAPHAGVHRREGQRHADDGDLAELGVGDAPDGRARGGLRVV